MLEIVVATSNPHKVEEIGAALALEGLSNVRLLSLADCVAGTRGLVLHEPEEIGTTFEENATIKALSYAQQTGRVCLADDSGLEIDALGGRPGVISSHYCTDGKEAGMSREERDAKNNARVMREMEGVEEARRGARFVCVMVVAGMVGIPEPPGTAFQAVSSDPLPAGEPDRLTACPTAGFQPVSKEPVNLVPGGPLEKTQRNLPHWTRDGSTYFVTWRADAGTMSPQERSVVLDACLHWHGKRALVDLVCVMPDHVHLIITPLRDDAGVWHQLPRLVQSIKGFSAREINAGRRTSGRFWQDERYDRIIRNADEFRETWNYVWTNPVRARLVGQPSDYPWSRGPLVVSPRLKACATVFGRSRGTFEGRIGMSGQVPCGSNGFGYDPLFLVAAEPYRFTRTSAELSPQEKNRLSHRGMAVREMAGWLRGAGFEPV